MWIFLWVLTQPLPLFYKEFNPKREYTQISLIPYNSFIDSVISQIHRDTIYSRILRLQNFRTRYSYTDSVLRASEWIRNVFLSFGYDSVVFQVFPHPENPSYPQRNVIAYKRGIREPQRHIVVGGHYDSVVYGPGTNPYIWAPGADDNGSGTTGVLEIARVLKDIVPDRSIIFIAFAAEEQGLYGSIEYAQFARSINQDIELMINMDMIGYARNIPFRLDIEGNSASREYIDLAAEFLNTYTSVIPMVSYSTYPYSDHWSFIQRGYKAFLAIETEFNYNNYHRNTDVVDSLNMFYIEEVLKGLSGLVLWLANRPSPPSNLSYLTMPTGEITLNFSPSSHSDVIGYYVIVRQLTNIDTVFTQDTFLTLDWIQPGYPTFIKVMSVDSLQFFSKPSDSLIIPPVIVFEKTQEISEEFGVSFTSQGIYLKGRPRERYSLLIYDPVGRIVREESGFFTDKPSRVSIQLKKGIYFFELVSGKRKQIKRVLIF